MAFVPFKGFGKYGVVHDSPDEALPLGVWSNARNIRFSGIQMEKMLEPTIAALWDTETNGDPLWLQGWADGLSTYWAVATANRIFVLRRSGQNSVGEWQDVTRASGQYLFGQWQSFAWGNTVIFNNGRDVPQIFNQDTFRFEDLPKWGLISSVDDLTNNAAPTRQVEATCTHLYPLKSFLVASGVTENGLYQPNKIWWSDATALATFKDVGDKQGPPSWDYESPSTLSAQSEIAPESGAIRTAELLNDNLIIYTDAAATALSVVGGANVMASRRLFNKGAASLHSVCEFNNQHFCVSQDQIYIHDGSTVKLIAKDRVEEEFFTRIGKGGRFGDGQVEWALLQAVKNPDRKEITITYGALGEDIPVNVPDNYSIATGAVQALPATASGTVVVPGDICKEYECDAVQLELQSVYDNVWSFEGALNTPTLSDPPGNGSGYFLDLNNPLDTDKAANWEGGNGTEAAPLANLDWCTDVKASSMDGSAGTSTGDVSRGFPDTGDWLTETDKGSMAVYVGNNSGNGNSVSLMAVMYSSFDSVNLQRIGNDIRFEVGNQGFDGSVARFDYLDAWTDNDGGALYCINWNMNGGTIGAKLVVELFIDGVSQGVQEETFINNRPPITDTTELRTGFLNGTGGFTTHLSAFKQSTITGQEAAALAAAIAQNQSDYVDPDPNCQPACKEYECDSLSNQLNLAFTRHWPMSDPIGSDRVTDAIVGETLENRTSNIYEQPSLYTDVCADIYAARGGWDNIPIAPEFDDWTVGHVGSFGGFAQITSGPATSVIALYWNAGSVGVELNNSGNDVTINITNANQVTPIVYTNALVPEFDETTPFILLNYNVDDTTGFATVEVFKNFVSLGVQTSAADPTAVSTTNRYLRLNTGWSNTVTTLQNVVYSPTETSPETILALREAWLQNQSDYVDPDPNCQPVCKEYECDALDKAIRAMNPVSYYPMTSNQNPVPVQPGLFDEVGSTNIWQASGNTVIGDTYPGALDSCNGFGFYSVGAIYDTGLAGNTPARPDYNSGSKEGMMIATWRTQNGTDQGTGGRYEIQWGEAVQVVAIKGMTSQSVTLLITAKNSTEAPDTLESVIALPSTDGTNTGGTGVLLSWTYNEANQEWIDVKLYDQLGNVVHDRTYNGALNNGLVDCYRATVNIDKSSLQYFAWRDTAATQDDVDAFVQAFAQNQSDYVDPNPNCVPAVQAQITKTPRRKDDPPTIQIPRRPGRDII